ncbi:Gfo/Idh/MocA family oxidoreductase [Neobacillus vireti]|uniref:Gfo/Idh/MocA family oxidoreductase n=1 Tax=Neobacillus vireti TaxID=220686 RepID=UPI003000D032
MSKLKAIQVGKGGFGALWLEILDQFHELELVAGVDIDPINLENAKGIIKNNNSVEFFTNHLEAFSKVEADIAVIITPPQTHKKLAAICRFLPFRTD